LIEKTTNVTVTNEIPALRVQLWIIMIFQLDTWAISIFTMINAQITLR